jgi:hypothetical protein
MGITAAGFPANRRLVNASTWNIGVRMGKVLPKEHRKSGLCNLPENGCGPLPQEAALTPSASNGSREAIVRGLANRTPSTARCIRVESALYNQGLQPRAK